MKEGNKDYVYMCKIGEYDSFFLIRDILDSVNMRNEEYRKQN